MAKLLTTDEPLWVACRQRELRVYRTFARFPPPCPVPDLLYANEHLTVLSLLPGERLGPDRHLTSDVPASTAAAVLRTLACLRDWSPPEDLDEPIPDYAARIDAAGLGTAVHERLAAAGPGRVVAHGDPIPPNLLVDGEMCHAVDFEFCGRYLPGHDLAVLYTVSATAAPTLAAAILAEATRGPIADGFAVSLTLQLHRERRMHEALPPSPLRTRRLAAIAATSRLAAPLWGGA
ncbi:phosphotransferase [Dactylosporangium vinaceum]|uniref:Phosphotransferase n=1 Tax=Dactylosporangium vinaceum TaxID=53362 RepID=A0ABV5MA35_9ACTN|nr:phosphotransferase [Dactylosporangium vinaceum]UAB93096.1 phosphotransferase [Dactylosporangium vinaceum]